MIFIHNTSATMFTYQSPTTIENLQMRIIITVEVQYYIKNCLTWHTELLNLNYLVIVWAITTSICI